ncbi:unnamed protein product [Mytilus coruscus]|uniref:Uncharacterized protein n=1 Tax=Mytilus coruscus TaxID=42192 RepID=A0A6J8AKZ0_MYTCO|nr:unnamed protein product [Mytilus coruscus]
MSQFPFQELEDKELSAFTCSIQDESAKLHINKLKASHRNSLKEIAVLKGEKSKLDTVKKENVILKKNLDTLNLECLQHVRLIQKIERELAEHASRTQNFEIEIVRLKEENLSLTNTRYRLTMDLKNAEMQDCHLIKKLKDEIQRLKAQHSDDIRECQDLLHELSVAENQIKTDRLRQMLVHVGEKLEPSPMELCGQFIGPAVDGQVIVTLCKTLPEGQIVKLTSVNSKPTAFHLTEVEVYGV